jgi:hypothetical protein
MPARYASFLVRCWSHRDGGRRIEIQHFQSETRTRVRSLLAAMAWVDARWSASGGAQAGAPDGPPTSRKEVDRPESEMSQQG